MIHEANGRTAMDFAARLVIEIVAISLFVATVALWAGIGAGKIQT
jgi:hypothetical protein